MPSGKPANEVNFQALKMKQLQECLGKSAPTIYAWLKHGCPRNQDKTYNAPAVFEWYVDTYVTKASEKEEKATSLTEQKTLKEIEYKEAQIQKILDKMIERSFHEQVLVSRAASLRQFLEQTLVMSAVKFVSLSIDEARSRLLNLAKQMMDAYTGGEENIEQED